MEPMGGLGAFEVEQPREVAAAFFAVRLALPQVGRERLHACVGGPAEVPRHLGVTGIGGEDRGRVICAWGPGREPRGGKSGRRVRHRRAGTRGRYFESSSLSRVASSHAVSVLICVSVKIASRWIHV